MGLLPTITALNDDTYILAYGCWYFVRYGREEGYQGMEMVHLLLQVLLSLLTTTARLFFIEVSIYPGSFLSRTSGHPHPLGGDHGCRGVVFHVSLLRI